MDIGRDEATVPDGPCWDADGDGHDDVACGGDDCDDTRDDTYPGAPEGCDGTWDHDCDGDATDLEIDEDGDGYAPASCGPPEGMVDCDDEDERVHPGAEELCDMIDQDCDGTWTDGGADDDLDGYLDEACGGDDCDDDHASAYPGADEVCLNGVDDDCDTVVDGPMVMMGNVRLTHDELGTYLPAMVWTGSEYGISWDEDSDDRRDVFFARVSAEGSVVGSNLLITDADNGGVFSSLAWTGSEFGLFWDNFVRDGASNIYLARISPEGGRISDHQITDTTTSSRFPATAWTGSEYGLSYSEGIDPDLDLFFVRVSPTGEVRGSEVQVNDVSAGAVFPVLAWTGSQYGVVWQDHRHDDSAIYFARISPGGSRMGRDVRLTSDVASAMEPGLAWTGSEFGAIWRNLGRTDVGTYFTRISAAGVEVGAEVRLSSLSGGEGWSSLAWTGSEYGALWPDRSSGANAKFTRISPAGGGLDTLLLPGYTWSLKQAIAWSGSEFGVAWPDDISHSGALDIVFNRIGLCE